MPDDLFKIERTGRVACCIMSNPERMNALGPEMGVPMIENIYQLIEDDEVGVIIIRGEGGNFCSGSEMDLLGENLDPRFLREAMIRINELLYKLHEGPKPVITEVDGYAFGGGLGLALASDITYATERAKFCIGFIRIGAVLDLGTSFFLLERIGMAKAKELAFTGDILSSEEASRIGLINRVVHHDTISEEVMKLARRISEKSADALLWTKRSMNRARHMDLKAMLDFEAHIQPLMLLSNDHKKAMKKLFSQK